MVLNYLTHKETKFTFQLFDELEVVGDKIHLPQTAEEHSGEDNSDDRFVKGDHQPKGHNPASDGVTSLEDENSAKKTGGLLFSFKKLLEKWEKEPERPEM